MKFLLILLLMLGSGQAAINMRVKIGTELATVIMSGAIIPDIIDGIDKDPKKCICKGTGIIVQGDGHTTKCPEHGKKGDTGEDPKVKETEDIKEELFFEKKKCSCDKCNCEDCGCLDDNCTCTDCEVKATVIKEETMVATTVKKKYDYILYHLGADWCPPCQRMKMDVWPGVNSKGTTTNDDVRDFLAENKIRLVILDKVKNEHQVYFKYYAKYMRRNGQGSPQYPTILAISVEDHDTPVFVKIGAPGKASMIKLLTEFLNEKSN